MTYLSRATDISVALDTALPVWLATDGSTEGLAELVHGAQA